jgi:hypothetical protein
MSTYSHGMRITNLLVDIMWLIGIWLTWTRSVLVGITRVA